MSCDHLHLKAAPTRAELITPAPSTRSTHTTPNTHTPFSASSHRRGASTKYTSPLLPSRDLNSISVPSSSHSCTFSHFQLYPVHFAPMTAALAHYPLTTSMAPKGLELSEDLASEGYESEEYDEMEELSGESRRADDSAVQGEPLLIYDYLCPIPCSTTAVLPSPLSLHASPARSINLVFTSLPPSLFVLHPHSLSFNAAFRPQTHHHPAHPSPALPPHPTRRCTSPPASKASPHPHPQATTLPSPSRPNVSLV